MNGKIGMRAFFMLLALLLVSVGVVPTVSAEPTYDDIRGVEAPTVTVTDDGIRDAVESVIVEIENSNISPEEKARLVDDLRSVISESPVSMDKLEGVLLNVGKALFGQEPPITPMWAGFMHQDMAKIAGEWMGLSSAECQILYDHADDPDGWGTFCIDHYALTGAPGEAERLADAARAKLSVGDHSGGFEFLAYSLHFMTDMSVPFHYVYEYLANHAAYESYVSGQWGHGTSQSFIDSVEDNYYYYYITDVSDSAMNLAVYSHQYMSDIQYTMDHYSNWQDNLALNQYTRNCLVEGAKYNMGLVDYVTR